jgi:5'-nucleotidase
MQKASANQRDPQKLTIGISSRALFNLEMENRIFERHGIEPYLRYQVRNEKKVLDPGVAFHLAKTFLSLNKFLSKPLVEVCVLSRNTANSSLRLFNSFDAHHLDIRKVALTSGEEISPYLNAFQVDLYLSANAETVSQALKSGVAAAMVYPESRPAGEEEDGIRIALDGDGVLFSLDAENIFREHGLDAFDAHERKHADVTLPEGPLASFLKKISFLQQQLGEQGHLIKTATARTSAPWRPRPKCSMKLEAAPPANDRQLPVYQRLSPAASVHREEGLSLPNRDHAAFWPQRVREVNIAPGYGRLLGNQRGRMDEVLRSSGPYQPGPGQKKRVPAAQELHRAGPQCL